MQKIAKVLFFAGCFILTISGAYAQKVLKGKVVANNKEPVAFANVYWLNSTVGITADENGLFQIESIDKINRLVISSVGYTSDTITVKKNSGFLDIQLKESVDLDQVEVVYRTKGTEISFMDTKKVEQISEKELRKAACCNLSESFETIPSIDVAFTDALTGTRKIRMLGLDGPYTYISRENMPGVRGLANAYGLNFIPGSWIESIQLSKGVGSVVNGFESIAGQINVELKKPEKEEIFVNAYLNQSGRAEVNYNQNLILNNKWSTMILLHGSTRAIESDNNSDGFLDFPLGDQINVINRWKYYGSNGLEGQFGINYVKDDKVGGQKGFNSKLNQTDQTKYGLEINTERIEVFGKLGYVFGKKPYKSMGLQASAFKHQQNSHFGLNEYDGTQESIYLNYLYRTQIKSDEHVITTGASFMYDKYKETAYDSTYNRVENVPGVFIEYTYAPSNLFSLVGGVRGDYNSIYGLYFNPRLHARWAINEKIVVRGVAGSGQRTANIFVENQAMFTTSRTFQLMGNVANKPFGLKQEKAYNFGLNFTKDFRLNYKEGFFGVDVYHTTFENQVVYDIEDSRYVRFYNLDGKSYSNTIQAEINYELFKFFDVKLAYRFIDVKTDYKSGLKQKPLTAQHRFFSNFAYETKKNSKGGQWKFDLTLQYLGAQRIPSTAMNIEANQRSLKSDGFLTANAQATRIFNKKWEAYLGMENMTNYKQKDPIIASNDPFGSEFDSSLIWGPIFGRMVYAGFRFTLGKE